MIALVIFAISERSIISVIVAPVAFPFLSIVLSSGAAPCGRGGRQTIQKKTQQHVGCCVSCGGALPEKIALYTSRRYRRCFSPARASGVCNERAASSVSRHTGSLL